MIVDSSALLAILFDEPGAEALLAALVEAPQPRMSTATWFETALVVESRGGRLAGLRFDEFIRTAGLTLVEVTAEQATTARTAWRHFGRIGHGERLAAADCFAYALAKTTGEPLLFAAERFARTDIVPALVPETQD